jgi:GTPase SAR1 family protein
MSHEDAQVKIAIIGDSGVGKSVLAKNLVNGTNGHSLLYNPTVGCEIGILKATHLEEEFFVELRDIGGNPRYALARSVFYDDLDGVIFMWDTSSESTFHSMDAWLREVKERLHSHSSKSDSTNGISQYRKPSIAGMTLPVMIVGGKSDKLDGDRLNELMSTCPNHVFVVSDSINTLC